MLIEYEDKRLALLETDRAAETRLPAEIIESFRRKLVVLRSAPDERTIRNWKSLRYEKLKGDREGRRSIRLNDKWRVVFELDTSTDPATLRISEVVDYHE
jgi:proteic killer suppression protein